MTDASEKQLGNTLWSIVDQLRGATDAVDFRDYRLFFLFLRYVSDKYEALAKGDELFDRTAQSLSKFQQSPSLFGLRMNLAFHSIAEKLA